MNTHNVAALYTLLTQYRAVKQASVAQAVQSIRNALGTPYGLAAVGGLIGGLGGGLGGALADDNAGLFDRSDDLKNILVGGAAGALGGAAGGAAVPMLKPHLIKQIAKLTRKYPNRKDLIKKLLLAEVSGPLGALLAGGAGVGLGAGAASVFDR